MNRLEEVKQKLEKIQKESIEGKGYRWDKQKKADEMALNLYLDGDVDWLIETIDRFKTALEFYADEEHWGMIDGVSYLKGADQWIAKTALEGNTP